MSHTARYIGHDFDRLRFPEKILFSFKIWLALSYLSCYLSGWQWQLGCQIYSYITVAIHYVT